MNINDYAKWTKNTRAKILGVETTDAQINTTHMVYGMMTELGELTDCFKKNLAYKKPVDWVNVKEEIGDLMWYIGGLCDVHGFDLENIIERNVAKLECRYPEKFTEYHATNRDLFKERGILEQE